MSTAHAITPEAYREVGVSLPDNAAVPLDANVLDEAGAPKSLRDLIRKPTVLVLADYTCTTLCGPIIAFVVSALEQSGLDGKGGYSLLAVGLDPKDGAAEAQNMRTTYFEGTSALAAQTRFVTTDEPNIDRITAALGYRYAYDKEHDQFVHPAAAYVLTSQGRVSRVLTGLGISGEDMRLALVEAGAGRIGTLGDQVLLLCSGFDPQHGAYNFLVGRLLAGAGVATVLVIGGGIGLLTLTGRSRAV